MSAKAVSFAPSQVSLFGSFPPFVATFDRTEAEVTAALIVRALEQRGNTWRPIAWIEIAEVIRSDLAIADELGEKATSAPRLIAEIAGNPFLRPDPWELVKRGFCRWTENEGGPIEFTDAGLERLRKWLA